VARWKRRAAGTTRYLTDIDLRTSIDSDDLIERVAVRAMEKDLVSHDTLHAELYLQPFEATPRDHRPAMSNLIAPPYLFDYTEVQVSCST
jgi:hypothetical protein